jgi:hypothetical protein
MGPFGMIVTFIAAVSFMTFVTFFGRLPALRFVVISGKVRFEEERARLLILSTTDALPSEDFIA